MKLLVSRSVKAFSRAFLLAVGVLVTGLGSPDQAQAQGKATIRAIKVDTSALPPGAFATAQNLQACLTQNLNQAFAGRIDPTAKNAPVLVVRPTVVFLANVESLRFGGGANGGGTSGVDTLEGEGILGNQRIPLIVAASPNYGPIGIPEIAGRVRTDSLCLNFAYWMARKV